MKTYLCENPGCALGVPGQPGRFTHGMSKDQARILTGNTDPEHHGHGVCPNCGQPGREENE